MSDNLNRPPDNRSDHFSNSSQQNQPRIGVSQSQIQPIMGNSNQTHQQQQLFGGVSSNYQVQQKLVEQQQLVNNQELSHPQQNVQQFHLHMMQANLMKDNLRQQIMLYGSEEFNFSPNFRDQIEKSTKSIVAEILKQLRLPTMRQFEELVQKQKGQADEITQNINQKTSEKFQIVQGQIQQNTLQIQQSYLEKFQLQQDKKIKEISERLEKGFMNFQPQNRQGDSDLQSQISDFKEDLNRKIQILLNEAQNNQADKLDKFQKEKFEIMQQHQQMQQVQNGRNLESIAKSFELKIKEIQDQEIQQREETSSRLVKLENLIKDQIIIANKFKDDINNVKSNCYDGKNQLKSLIHELEQKNQAERANHQRIDEEMAGFFNSKFKSFFDEFQEFKQISSQGFDTIVGQIKIIDDDLYNLRRQQPLHQFASATEEKESLEQSLEYQFQFHEKSDDLKRSRFAKKSFREGESISRDFASIKNEKKIIDKNYKQLEKDLNQEREEQKDIGRNRLYSRSAKKVCQSPDSRALMHSNLSFTEQKPQNLMKQPQNQLQRGIKEQSYKQSLKDIGKESKNDKNKPNEDMQNKNQLEIKNQIKNKVLPKLQKQLQDEISKSISVKISSQIPQNSHKQKQIINQNQANQIKKFDDRKKVQFYNNPGRMSPKKKQHNSKDRNNIRSNSTEEVKLDGTTYGKQNYEFEKTLSRSQRQQLEENDGFIKESNKDKQLINLQKESYSVDCMMMNIKYLDNVIVCDDKQGVSFIDPNKMKKIAQINIPSKINSLYSAFKYQKYIYLAINNNNLIKIDSTTYKEDQKLNIDAVVCSFTEYHAKNEIYAILGCKNGIIKIFQPSKNMIVASFSIDKAIYDHQNHLYSRCSQDSVPKVPLVGNVNEVIKTKYSQWTNEFMVVTSQGLFFINIYPLKNPQNNEIFQFEFDFEQQYFRNQEVEGVFEYHNEKIIALVKGQKNIALINRLSENQETQIQISELSNDSDYRSLKPFPNYNYETFPYVLLKDSMSLNVINVRKMQSIVIINSSISSLDSIYTSLIDFKTNLGRSEQLTLFNVEQVSDPNLLVKGHVSSLKKITINTKILESCFM